jgi:phosphate starvation-inducible PhoH-like protein
MSKRNSKNSKPKLTALEAKTSNQKEYIRAIVENDIIICSGPSGSGKSFISSGMAAHQLHEGYCSQIIVTRPLVCTGKDIGSLPGEMNDKIAPYLLPMEENLKHFFGRIFYGHYFNNYTIQYRPLELMRGATFHDSYMILDEAQNCTKEQIKMFITRMGRNSKVLINGDVNQNDLMGLSGLEHTMERISDIERCAVCRLEYSDIQRHGILGKVLMALEE